MCDWRAPTLVLATVVLVMAGCADDAGESGDQSDADVGAQVDVGDVDNTPDVAADADADTDAGPTECEPFAAIEVAGTPATDTLAADPARCGQSAYEWLDSTRLGEITEVGEHQRFPAQVLESVLASEGVVPPRPLEHDTRVVQYTYMTQDRGDLVEASAMIAFPDVDEPGAGPTDVLLLLHGTTGFTDACAASDDLGYRGLAALLASFGYLVVAPDYIGLKGLGEPTGFLHPYLVGEATAIASLDAVRAASELAGEDRGGWCVGSRVVTFGASQGGHAALWVDRLAPYYAREIELLGTVATVPPADMLGQMGRAIDELVSATGNTVAFLGAASEWYGLRDRLDEVFVSPLDVDVPVALESGCDFDDVIDEPTSTADIFTQELRDVVDRGELDALDPWGCITAENGLTTTSVQRIQDDEDAYGILFITGEADSLVHTPIERDAFETLCEQGLPIDYLECADAGHGEASFFALPELLEFIDARFSGQAFQRATTCQAPSAVQCSGTPQEN